MCTVPDKACVAHGTFQKSVALTYIPNSRDVIMRTPTKRTPDLHKQPCTVPDKVGVRLAARGIDKLLDVPSKVPKPKASLLHSLACC